MKRHGSVVATTLLALAMVTAITPPARAGGPRPGAAAPAFALPTATGTVSLDSLAGKVVLVDFWASWCGPCKTSFPWMATMQQRYGPKGFAVVAINVDKSRKSADDFLSSRSVPFLVAYDPAGKVAKDFHVQGMPTSYLIAPDHSILYSRSGFDLKHAIEVEARIAEACSR